jgi:hypothetical protein
MQIKRPSKQSSDELKHFSRDGPAVRLLALFVCKLPMILSASGVGYAIAKLHWFS